MTIWGYARVSTVDQDPQLQLDALAAAGVAADHVVVDQASGSRKDRHGLNQLLTQLEDGDVLVVWKLDRLGRSLSHLVTVVDDLGRRGVEFRSLTEALDTTSAGGRLIFHVMAAIAQFERELIIERTRAALAAARAKARPLGRPSRVTREQYQLVHQMAAAGRSHRVIASSTGLTRHVVGRLLRGEIASLERRFGDAAQGDDELVLYEPTRDVSR